jgi:hypothetical protein
MCKNDPENLTKEQKYNWKNICSDIIELITKQPDVLGNVVTCDEMWIFQYDPETRQSTHWNTPTLP